MLRSELYPRCMGSHRHWVSARDPSGRFVSAKFAQAAVRQSERNLSALLMVELRDGLDGGRAVGTGSCGWIRVAVWAQNQ